MSRIAYVNGRYVSHRNAAVSIEDRGYQFADGVYEVIEIFDGSLIDESRHLDRLERSLRELAIKTPVSRQSLSLIMREVARRNRIQDGLIYLQITRGVARRDHAFPEPSVRAALVVTGRHGNIAKSLAQSERGISVITMADLRWKRPDIKSISLLPNVLAKEQAHAAGASEAWLLTDDGFVKEGASSNAWIVNQQGRILTRPADGGILRGITRTTLLDMLEAEGLSFEERPFSLEEAMEAKEAFVTGATTLVTPVIAIDGKKIGNGQPGPVAAKLREGFRAAAKASSLSSRMCAG